MRRLWRRFIDRLSDPAPGQPPLSKGQVEEALAPREHMVRDVYPQRAPDSASQD